MMETNEGPTRPLPFDGFAHVIFIYLQNKCMYFVILENVLYTFIQYVGECYLMYKAMRSVIHDIVVISGFPGFYPATVSCVGSWSITFFVSKR